MNTWSAEHARALYSLPHWSGGYFDVNQTGHVVVRPFGTESTALSLPDIVDSARANGARLPLLLRFPDILQQRLHTFQTIFSKVQAEWDYQGGYTAVYPIKVNQQRSVAGTLAAQSGAAFGLEAGSKPELMAVLALSQPGGLVICNGYKDREYIRLALIGRKLGLNTFIVIEKPSELSLILEQAQALNVRPGIGVRMRLTSLGSGKWQNSGGDKAKFGLSPRQLLTVWKQLRGTEYADCLNLLHFHMGSQISNVRDISKGMREATRYFVELSRLGASIHYVDVGGGLGVDYEGTRSRSECSVNYSLETYAHHIVQPLAEACQQYNLAPPRIITECGRAMTAHHAVLITNVSDVELAPQGRIPDIHHDEPPAIRHLREIYAELGQRPAIELFLEAQHFHAEGLDAYALGQIDLPQRARIDDLFYAIAHEVRARLNIYDKRHRQLHDELNERLVDKYFVNFSVFESIPDVWAIDQIFPIMPIERLNDYPDRRGVIADLTCDSDGTVKTYVENEGLNTSLPLHSLRSSEPYRIGFFLVGAYQEMLGDIHNLFGDTDAMEVHITAEGYTLIPQRQGDCTDAILDYIGYPSDELRTIYQNMITNATLPNTEAEELLAALVSGLTGYTYLSD